MQKIGFNNRYGLQDAVLERRKPLTRRIIPELVGKTDVRLSEFGIDDSGKVYITELNSGIDIYPKYQIGEVVAIAQAYKDVELNTSGVKRVYNQSLDIYEHPLALTPGWTNKMFVKAELMPHQIRITNIRYERLQDISDEDCLLEGIYKQGARPGVPDVYAFDTCLDQYGNVLAKIWYTDPRDAFAALIDKVSGKGTWASNPWVWVYEFELVN